MLFRSTVEARGCLDQIVWDERKYILVVGLRERPGTPPSPLLLLRFFSPGCLTLNPVRSRGHQRRMSGLLLPWPHVGLE